MARIRTIKPEFFTSLTIADLTPEQRLTFIGLWTHVDDEGRCIDDARLIKAAVWPLDDRGAADVEVDLKALTASSLIVRYTLNRKRFLAVTNWHEHQRINRPTPSNLPDPDDCEILPVPPLLTCGNEPSGSTHAQLTEDALPERKGREQGKEGKGTPASDSSVVALPLDGVDAADADKPRGKPKANKHQIADELTAAFWERHKSATAQTFIALRSIIRAAIANGLDRDDVARALDHLAREGTAISGGAITNALKHVRKQRGTSFGAPAPKYSSEDYHRGFAS